ncbi:purine-cytosine permease fcy22 [Fusarium beomiforme]|uniref:Purine-cytosine permease fcy22 n=1 Tax=Fusarium beomiforme TaxID=44412 RepID=A0A9P5A829_9HYPO|nr:purine-cytosine permease fcy22 [Fusarium beomiforme]
MADSAELEHPSRGSDKQLEGTHSKLEMSKEVDPELGMETETDRISLPGTSEPVNSFWQRFVVKLGVESRGLEPVPRELRTDERYANILTLFSTTSIGLLPIGIGAASTLGYGLSLKQAAPMIICLQLAFLIPSCYILTLAPLLGMRQWCQFRYVYGIYFNQIVSLVSLLGIAIFGITAAVTGGQTLASVNPGTLSVDSGIAIIFVIGCCIGFMGYKVLHGFARYAWIPASFGILILIGCAGDQLHQQAPPRAVGAKPWLSMISMAAGISFAWGGVIGDYACYMPPKAPRFRLALYFLSGFGVMFSLMMILGAALGGAALQIPTWAAALGEGGTGAVVGEVVVSRLGGFGKFVLTILALTVVITTARDIYSISLAVQAVIPWLERVPRAILALVTTGVLIGVAIPASKSFISSLSALVSILSYSSGITVTTFLIEWFWFRRADPDSLDPAIWDDGKALPSGIPAIITFAIAWGPIICGMDTVWLTGPLAKVAGDLGWELAILTTVIVYTPLRAVEIRFRGRF